MFFFSRKDESLKRQGLCGKVIILVLCYYKHVSLPSFSSVALCFMTRGQTQLLHQISSQWRYLYFLILTMEISVFSCLVLEVKYRLSRSISNKEERSQDTNKVTKIILPNQHHAWHSRGNTTTNCPFRVQRSDHIHASCQIYFFWLYQNKLLTMHFLEPKGRFQKSRKEGFKKAERNVSREPTGRFQSSRKGGFKVAERKVSKEPKGRCQKILEIHF